MRRFLLASTIFGLISLVLVSRFSPQKLDDARVGADHFAAPLVSIYTVPRDLIVGGWDDIQSYFAVRRENLRLKGELRDGDALQRRLERLTTENQALRRQMSVNSWPSEIVATGKVLSHGGGSYFKSILLAAGSSSGIERGHAVVSSAGVIGQVVAVAPRLSRVLLMNDLSSRIPVVIDQSATPAIALGDNAATLKLDFLPIDFVPEVGARVSTSGAGGVFPAGLPVGRLFVVELKDGKTQLRLEPFADLDQSGFVTVLRPAVRVDADMPVEPSPTPRVAVSP